MGQSPSTIPRRSTYQLTHTPDDFVLKLIRPQIEERLQRYLSQPNQKVLDIGCGRAPFRALIKAQGAAYFGFDVQQNEDGTVDFLGTLDGELPATLKGKQFEILLCTEVLEHVADWDRAFHNLAALCSPGGEILITCPNFYPLHEEPHDYWRPTSHAFRYYAARAGLEVKEYLSLGQASDVLGLLLGHTMLTSEKSLWPTVIRKGLSFAKQTLFRWLLEGRLQKNQLKGPFFLSHLVILRKPPTS